MKKLIYLLLLLPMFAFGQIEATVLNKAKVKESPNVFSDVVYTFQYEAYVLVTEYLGDFYKVKYDGKTGFINEIWIKPSPELEKFKSDNKEKWEANKKNLEDEIADHFQKSEEKRVADLVKKFGKTNGENIAMGAIWIGMTEEMARASRGVPQTVNVTVGEWGRTEQWVYSNTYLYFSNGKLKSYQSSY